MSGGSRSPAIDVDRLRGLLDGVNAFGRSDETGGFNRPAFSDADMGARRWFAGQMEAAGLEVRWDGAGNLFGRWGAGEGPVIMAGSHLDTVREGGAYDGTLGVCLALESVRALKEAGVQPKAPVEIVVTSDEEGRFGGMLGSQAIAGTITDDWIARASDADGVTLREAMTAQQLDPDAIEDAARAPGSIAAFLELHIEQGPTLKTEGKSVGIAESVSGLCNWQVTLTGVANHSGTTPMDLRADAFAGLAEIAATIPSIIRIVGRADTRVTVGKVDVFPNHPHTVPGKVVFNLMVRDPEEAVIRSVTAALRALIRRIADTRKLGHTIEEMSWLSPVTLDAGLADRVENAAKRLDIETMRMVSGAGHDAQTMQAICPSTLIFVPSENGISHAPEEHTEWEDIEKGAVVYLATLRSLCMDPPIARTAVVATPEIERAGPPEETPEENAPADEAANAEPDEGAAAESEAVNGDAAGDETPASGDEAAESGDGESKADAPEAGEAVETGPDEVSSGEPDAEAHREKKGRGSARKAGDASAEDDRARKSGQSGSNADDMDFDFDFEDLMTDDDK